MTRLTSPSDPQAPHARFTVEQFHRLCEAVPGQRLGLIAGEVLTVLAKGTRHSVLVNRVTQLITLWLAARTDCPWELWVESPLCLGERDEPEPDLALVRQRSHGYLSAHPEAPDTVLVIEVSDSSLAFDLQTKGHLYRNAGIPSDWVIDVSGPQLIRAFGPDQQDPPLESLHHRIEELLLTMPPASEKV